MEVLPLSFQADTHHSDGSDSRMGNVAEKYSKKSGDMSRSSVAKRDSGVMTSWQMKGLSSIRFASSVLQICYSVLVKQQ